MQNIIIQPKEKKNLLTLALLSIIILTPTIIYSIVTDCQSFLITIFLLLILSFAIRKPIKKGKRETIYILILSIIGANIINQLFTLSSDRFFLPPIKFYCPLFILGAVFYSFTPLTKRKTNIIIALSLIAYLSTGNILNNHQPNENFTLTNSLINSFHITYGSFMLLQTLAILLVIPRAEQHITYNITQSKHLYKYSIISISLFISFTITGILSYNIYKHRSAIQYNVNGFIKKYISFNSNYIVFNDEPYIGSLKQYSEENQQSVIMRIISQHPPGYLRTNAYILYQRGVWTNNIQPQSNLKRINTTTNETYISYIIPSKKNETEQNNKQKIKIYIANHIKMYTIPMPGNTTNIIISAKNLKLNANGVLSLPTETAIPKKYELLTKSYKFQAAYSGINPPQRVKKYKKVPRRLHKTLKNTLLKIFPSGYKKLTPQEKAEQITQYFAKNYKYSLAMSDYDQSDEYEDLKYKNPIKFFLERSKTGHCELFATATVLLLREANVPARYITGFLCHEKHPTQNYYITRLRDAHAWTEIYLQKEKRWILIDSTPANGKPSTDKKLSLISAFFDNIILKYQNFIEKIKNKNFSAIIINAIIAIDKIITWSVTHPLYAIMLIILVIGIYYMVRKRKKEKKKKRKKEKTPLYNALKLINKLLKKNKITVKSSMTLRELTHKVDKNPQIIYANEIKQIILNYEKLRYSKLQKIENINQLIKTTTKLLKSKPKLKKNT